MKDNRTSREVWSWVLYDWANSAFSVTVISGFFPVFFKQYWSQGADSTVTTARLGTLISAASFIIAVLSPFLGALADLRGNKKLFTFIFMVLGVISCFALSWIGPGEWVWAAVWYALGILGFNSSCTFYDSLLPSVAPAKNANFVSSLGYSFGYLGGGVLFALNVVMYLKPELFGLGDGVSAVKVAFSSVGIWWFLFSIPLFRFVPEPKIGFERYSWSKALAEAHGQLVITLKELLAQKNLMTFIVAYWLYIDGVYTIANMAVDFGISLGFTASSLIAALLLVQFVGFPFAMLFSKLSYLWGSRVPILICLIFYSITLIGAMYMTQTWHFYVLAVIIGMIQGGVQALSRSLFSRMTPIEKSGEYFGFFNLIGKFASILGPLLLGWGTYLFGDHRKGLLGILILLLGGAALLWKVKEPDDRQA